MSLAKMPESAIGAVSDFATTSSTFVNCRVTQGTKASTTTVTTANIFRNNTKPM